VGIGAIAESPRVVKAIIGEKIGGTAAFTLHHLDDQLFETGDKKMGIVVFDANSNVEKVE